ncbi:nucleoside-diphosphate kinase [Micromonospora sp. WMMD1120]|uniref:nucleoside-diphosphate kinase n=1 Tax=Micromonospora sp. WMMD1120 TaxID=3016106 RepID=UPI002416ED67|nr:nucleoside-diphosphate kinase [Micromonospora sp. WMMD1120]MDG4810866.1 nucleoside-diphosphate kinase [Micromonospora sp. WMMD1120]
MSDDLGRYGREILPTLSVLPAKRRLYGLDLYFQEAWAELVTALGSEDGVLRLLDRTALILFKPDAVVRRMIGPACEWMTARGIRLVAAETCLVSRHVTRALWQHQWNFATPERRALTELYMSRSPSLLLVVQLPPDSVPATVRLSALKGPAVTTERSPEHLRSALATSNHVVNGVHSTDEPADVVRELSIFLDADQRQRVYTHLLDVRDARLDDIVERLYREVPTEADLGFAARRQRWLAVADRTAPDRRRALQRALSRDAGRDRVDWRELAADLSRMDADWSDWDTVVLGTELMVSNEEGLDRVLPGVAPALWTANAAAHQHRWDREWATR